jgi:hypothetical protein
MIVQRRLSKTAAMRPYVDALAATAADFADVLISPARSASAAACTRVDTPSLLKILDTVLPKAKKLRACAKSLSHKRLPHLGCCRFPASA